MSIGSVKRKIQDYARAIANEATKNNYTGIAHYAYGNGVLKAMIDVIQKEEGKSASVTAGGKIANDGFAVYGFKPDVMSPQQAVAAVEKALHDANVPTEDEVGALYAVTALLGQDESNWDKFSFRGHRRAVSLWIGDNGKQIVQALRAAGLKLDTRL